MENLGVNLKVLIAQLINFGLFFFIFKKFIAAPFIDVMKDEKKKAEDRKKGAEAVEKQRLLLAEEEKVAREEIKQKTKSSLLAVRQGAEAERATLLKKAQAEANELIKKGEQKIAEERTVMEKEYKQTVAKVSVLAVENVLKDFLSEDMQKQVNERVLTHLNK